MSEYTPTTEEVRSSYPLSDADREVHPALAWDKIITVEGFDRWLVKFEREVAAKAWDEGAQWAAVECGAIDRVENAWIAEGDNPYRGAPEQEGKGGNG